MMEQLLRVAVLTGGGDVPGLNPAIAAVIRAADAHHIEIVGVMRGWHGLLWVDPHDPVSVAEHTVALGIEQARHLEQRGGTVLRSSRTNPRNIKPCTLPPAHPLFDRTSSPIDATAHIIATLEALRIDAVVAMGGEDTLGFAAHLSDCGVRVVGIPKTMDNDIFGTELCLGFATCVARTTAAIHQLRSCSASHERLCIVEVMGRNSGASSLYPAVVARADRALIAEHPFDVQLLGDKLMADRQNNPERYAIVTVSEGARFADGAQYLSGTKDAFGHHKLGGIGHELGRRLQDVCQVGTLIQSLGYLVRSGAPDPIDVMAGFAFGALAIERLQAGATGEMMHMRRGVFGFGALREVLRGQRTIDVDCFYDAAELRPRLPSFVGRSLYAM